MDSEDVSITLKITCQIYQLNYLCILLLQSRPVISTHWKEGTVNRLMTDINDENVFIIKEVLLKRLVIRDQWLSGGLKETRLCKVEWDEALWILRPHTRHGVYTCMLT